MDSLYKSNDDRLTASGFTAFLRASTVPGRIALDQVVGTIYAYMMETAERGVPYNRLLMDDPALVGRILDLDRPAATSALFAAMEHEITARTRDFPFNEKTMKSFGAVILALRREHAEYGAIPALLKKLWEHRLFSYQDFMADPDTLGKFLLRDDLMMASEKYFSLDKAVRDAGVERVNAILTPDILAARGAETLLRLDLRLSRYENLGGLPAAILGSFFAKPPLNQAVAFLGVACDPEHPLPSGEYILYMNMLEEADRAATEAPKPKQEAAETAALDHILEIMTSQLPPKAGSINAKAAEAAYAFLFRHYSADKIDAMWRARRDDFDDPIIAGDMRRVFAATMRIFTPVRDNLGGYARVRRSVQKVLGFGGRFFTNTKT